MTHSSSAHWWLLAALPAIVSGCLMGPGDGAPCSHQATTSATPTTPCLILEDERGEPSCRDAGLRVTNDCDEPLVILEVNGHASRTTIPPKSQDSIEPSVVGRYDEYKLEGRLGSTPIVITYTMP